MSLDKPLISCQDCNAQANVYLIPIHYVEYTGDWVNPSQDISNEFICLICLAKNLRGSGI